MEPISLKEYKGVIFGMLEKRTSEYDKKLVEKQIEVFFNQSNTTQQTDGSEEVLDKNEIVQALKLARDFINKFLPAQEEKTLSNTNQNENATDNQSVGNIVSILCENGTTFKIEGTTITTIADGKTSAREMTEAEKLLPVNELLQQLEQENSVTSTTKDTDNIQRQINRDGVEVTYTVGDNGIKCIKIKVDKENQSMQAFLKGSTEIEMDKQGVYSFRGIRSYNKGSLKTDIISSGQYFAVQTAIYKDLQEIQKNGKKLSDVELEFMTNYENDLKKYNLQINKEGNLEDIPN